MPNTVNSDSVVAEKPRSWKGFTLRERFDMQVSKTDGCWIWNGARSSNGYGVIARKNRVLVGAHVISHELFIGPVPHGLEVDHLCHNRACVNPDHLQAVTHSVNVIRGNSPSAFIHRSGFCRNGHPLTPENRDAKRRRCKVCQRDKARARYWRIRANN